MNSLTSSKKVISLYFTQNLKIQRNNFLGHSTATMLDEISMKVRRFQRKQDEFQVDVQDVRRGAVIVDFLMETCPPGTVPDPVMLAAILTQVC